MNNGTIRKVFTALSVGLLALGLGGCVHEYPANKTGDDTGGVLITVKVPSAEDSASRSISGAGGEAMVYTIDVLVFEDNAGTLELSEHAVGTHLDYTGATQANDYRTQFRVRLTANPDAELVMVVANAANVVDGIVNPGGTAGAGLGQTKKAVMDALVYAAANPAGTAEGWKWKANPAGATADPHPSTGNYTPIPMYGEKGVSAVTSGMKITDMELMRMLARVDVANSATSQFTLTNIYVVNYQTAGFIAPEYNAVGGLTGGWAAIPVPPGVSAKQTGFANAMNYGVSAGAQYDTGGIYLYEAPATTGAEGTTGHTDAVCLLLKGTLASDSGTYYYRVDFTSGEDGNGEPYWIDTDSDGIPDALNPLFDATSGVGYSPVWRNYRYVFDILRVDGPGYTDPGDALRSLGIMNNLQTTFHMVDESGLTNNVYNGQHYLSLGPDVTLAASSGSSATVKVATNYVQGWEIDTSFGGGTGVTYDGSQTGWLNVGSTGSGTFGGTITATANSKNPTTADRVAYVHVKAGRLGNKLKVTQLMGPPAVDPGTVTDGGNAPNIMTYVGAFWRADQRAERLISIPVTDAAHAGKWAVQVLDYGDFSEGDILFSAWDGDLTTVDPTDPDDVTPNPLYVTGDKTYLICDPVAVNGRIAFKVGLKQKWSEQAGYATKKVRYARVVVSFGEYNGEEYYYNRVIWLRQGEAADYVLTLTDAAKFSPYNLTHPDYKMGNSTTDEYKVVPGRGQMLDSYTYNDYFTAYPSQGGAFYQWTGLAGYERRAISPIIEVQSDWDDTHALPDFDDAHETCPPGWHRPSSLEFAGSLSSTAYVYGYYSDGFFDRRELETPLGAFPGDFSSTAAGSVEIACCGNLAFNPDNNASLFFPDSGRVVNSGQIYYGALMSVGAQGNYWLSTSYDYRGAYCISSPVAIGQYYRYFGFSVRCVAD